MKIAMVIFIFFIISNCSEKTSYSGKIITDNNIDYLTITNKEQLINVLGEPSFIDPIENKYVYFSEKKIFKNFFDQKIANRIILVFKFDKNFNVVDLKEYELDDEKQLTLIKETTPNNLIETGLLESLFGGVGRSSLPNTSE